jgi:hypothetical protein
MRSLRWHFLSWRNAAPDVPNTRCMCHDVRYSCRRAVLTWHLNARWNLFASPAATKCATTQTAGAAVRRFRGARRAAARLAISTKLTQAGNVLHIQQCVCPSARQPQKQQRPSDKRRRRVLLQAASCAMRSASLISRHALLALPSQRARWLPFFAAARHKRWLIASHAREHQIYPPPHASQRMQVCRLVQMAAFTRRSAAFGQASACRCRARRARRPPPRPRTCPRRRHQRPPGTELRCMQMRRAPPQPHAPSLPH